MSQILEIGVNEGERARNRKNALGVVNDLQPRLDELREQADVHPMCLAELFGLSETPGLSRDASPHFSVLGYESADRVFRENQTFSSRAYQNTAMTWGPNMLAMDEPEHRRYRALAQPAFAQKTMESWESRWLGPILDRLIEELRGSERAELYLGYCARFPAHTIASSFGIEAADVGEFHDRLLRMANPSAPEDAAASSQWVRESLQRIIADRRAAARDDVISLLVASELVEEDSSRHRLSDEEIQGFAGLLLTAGSGTTYRGMGILLLALLDRPALLEQVEADRSLIPQVVDEVIRWEPPLTSFSRFAERDVELAGVEIPAGSIVDVVVAAANHDPRRWNDPHAFDPFRPVLPNLGFASGPHFCIGNQLARMELRVALERLLTAFPNLRLDPEQPAPYVTGVLFRMPTALPVLLGEA